MNPEISCMNCIYCKNSTCQLLGDTLPRKGYCTQFASIQSQMSLERQICIKREDVEKMLIFAKTIFATGIPTKKMRIIVDYDPQEIILKLNTFTIDE